MNLPRLMGRDGRPHMSWWYGVAPKKLRQLVVEIAFMWDFKGPR
jgi:hypothetical protein